MVHEYGTCPSLKIFLCPHTRRGVERLLTRWQTPNELTVQYARIASMARDVVLMCTIRVRRKLVVVNGESVSDNGFVVIVAGAPCPLGGNL